MRGIVVSGGSGVNLSSLEEYFKGAYIVCCDGGIKNFYNFHILPDIVVGDFDSIDEQGIDFIKDHNIKTKLYDPIKNFTDTEAGVNLLMDMNIDEIIIVAATGTRMDHTLANILFLKKLYNKVEACLIDNNNNIKYVEKGEYSFQKGDYKYISVIALSENIVYSTEGMKYKAENLKISNSEIRGVSNELVSDEAKIVVHEGRGFIIRAND